MLVEVKKPEKKTNLLELIPGELDDMELAKRSLKYLVQNGMELKKAVKYIAQEFHLEAA